ncbi:MAG TPA: serine/threonine-protein kinase [Gemmatimonadaceae bacterium]|nr:serine/threonine-protein kinase [Gemmatimonadaceae bacterium]
MAEPNPFDTNLRNAFESAYVLERELTGGGMSRVFLATERALNRRVVIKVLPPDLAAGVNRERFRREIQLAAQLQHPHIVPLYSAGEHGELLYYTMPYIEGESLKHAIHERGSKTRFSPKEVAGILHDVVDALAYAHERGVIHRDIKPGNVLRSGRHAVVTDFGVAKAISAAMPAVGMTTSGMAIGTPAYMAPEQLAGDPAADHRVDIYAVGLLAYELLTGEAPFSEPSPQETMAAQLTRDPQPIDRTRMDVPPAFSAIVMRCLAKSPDRRPQSAVALLAELDGLSLVSGHYAPSALPRRRQTAGVVGVAVILVAIAIIWRERHGPGRDAVPAFQVVTAESARVLPAAPAAAAPRPALTRADSLAIAKAVQKKMAERESAAPKPVRNDSAEMAKMYERIRVDVEKLVLDSLAKTRPLPTPPGAGTGASAPVFTDRKDGTRRSSVMTPAQIDSVVRAGRGAVDMAFGMNQRSRSGYLDKAAFDARAATMGPPRRIVIWDHPPQRRNPTVEQAGSTIMNVLRKTLAAQPRFSEIDRDSTLALLAKTRDRDSVSRTLNADMMATIRGSLVSPDSVIWILSVWDLTANNAFANRSVTAGKVSLSDPLANVDSLTVKALHALQEMDRAPRKGYDPRMTPPVMPIAPTPVNPPKKP